MIYSKNKNFLFIAVPKTGTTTCESHIEEHMCLFSNPGKDLVVKGNPRNLVTACGLDVSLHKHSKYLELCDSLTIKPFVFGFVRNPFDRVVSWFNYLVGGHNDKGTQAEHARVYGTKYLTKNFYDFCKYAPPFVFQNQYQFFVDNQGRFSADYVGRYEDLKEDFNKVADIIGLYPIISNRKKNVSGEGVHYSSYYDNDTISYVEAQSQLDLKFFNYKFEKK